LAPLPNQLRRRRRRRSGGTHIPPRSLGVLASRDAGMRFVNALVGEHEGAGLKSADEVLILLRVAASAGRGSRTSRTRCGIEVGGGGVDAALPQMRFNIAQASDCMIEREREARWCTGDKKHTTISHLRGCDCDDSGHSDGAKEVEEGHSRRAPASGISQGERGRSAMTVEDGGRSTKVSAADGSGRRRTLTKPRHSKRS
jgi:hypothetical protein